MEQTTHEPATPPRTTRRHPATSTTRRSSDEVVTWAVVVGSLAAVPIALLSLSAVPFRESLAGGSGVGQALGSSLPTAEDWEILPFYLLGAVLVGALVAAVAAVAWLVVTSRGIRAPWLARLVAVALAGGLPASPWVVGAVWPTAVTTASLAGLVALVAVRRVGYERRRTSAS